MKQSQHQGGQQQSTARFTFAESATRTSEGIDDTKIDLSQLDESGGRNISTIASQSPGDTSSNNASVTIPAVETIEPTAGTSTAEEANVPQISVDEVEGKLKDSSLTLLDMKTDFSWSTYFEVCYATIQMMIFSNEFELRLR